jgi:uncharacterized protein
MTAEAYHEAQLTEKTKDLHRAIRSLMEELEAVDWYQQRIDATADADLKTILAHNRDEEKEHAAMVLEWLRRNDEGFAKELKDWLFTSRPFTKEDAPPPAETAAAASPSSSLRTRQLTVASLRGAPRT